MVFLKILLVCITVVLSACNKSSRSVENNIPNHKINPNRTCVPEGEILAGNIIGGKIVKQSDEDSNLVVMLLSNKHICTATPIHKRVLLTAAHCIVGNKSNTSVTFHTSHSCESGFNKNQHIQGISSTIVHERFNNDPSADKMVADIALVVLEEDIPEGYEIFKIADPSMIRETERDLYLYGYGITSSNSKDSGMLRKIKLEPPLYKILYSKDKIFMDQGHSKGICKGDSGGPSFVKIEDELQILGVNSYVAGVKDNICANEGYQTLADSYRNWIHDKILEIEERIPKR